MSFQTQTRNIVCLTESSTSGRASPSRWDSEGQSLALKEVRTPVIRHCPHMQSLHISRVTHKSVINSISVSVSLAEREAEVLYEVLFDEEFAGGLNIR